MKHFLLLTLVVGTVAIGSGAVSANADGRAADSVSTGKYRWKNRVLLIFTGNDTDATYQRQLRFLDGNAAEMDDRDMVVGAFTDETGGVLGSTALSPKGVASLRRQFDLAPGTFAVVLLGKDGGVKLRRNEPVQADALFALIDAMPMRQQEARR